MANILRGIETPYIDAQTLLLLSMDFKQPRERILRMVAKGDLIRLKNGFYLIADQIRQGAKTILPYEQVANLLYGPSYVSLEWALSFYGIIPERVHTVTCMTLGRAKEFHTPVGDFAYYPVNPSAYPVGIDWKETAGFVGNFFMATPEKALADTVFKTCRGLNKKQLELELFESKRMDIDQLRKLNKRLLSDIADSYRSKIVGFLTDIIGLI